MSAKQRRRSSTLTVATSSSSSQAQYPITRVHHLEMENVGLSVRINESEEAEKKERKDLVVRCEAKIKELRDHIDEALKDNTRLKMDVKTAFAERDDLHAKIAKLEDDLEQSEKSSLRDESLTQDLQADVSSMDKMCRQLEEESKQLAEIHRKRQLEMTTTTSELERTYESRLQEQLQAMRAEFDARLNKNRRDIDEACKNKVNEANEARQQANHAREESARLRSLIPELEKSVAAHETRVGELNKKIADLQNQLLFMRDDADVRIQQRDGRIAELQQEIDRTLSEYQDLFELKVQLDGELRAYQSLLEGEESRFCLNISQHSSMSSAELVGDGAVGSRSVITFSNSQLVASPRRSGIKMKHFIASGNSSFYRNAAKTYKTTANSECGVEIDAHDTSGKFVRLINKGEEAVSIGQWSIKSVASERETVYKFHSRQCIKPSDTITVWSVNSGRKSAPPSQLVMKNQQWPAGDHVKTILVDMEGTVMATRESIAELQVGAFAQDDDQDPGDRCSLT
ncbi:Lamin-1 [Toxocara canis]|uniref:Lamin-1 n=1 Tax=Toxocara canis TaxID=6265 RepID=A0A0B2UQF0_TOXCA|nr:Lamin-1 [Toxocara canis]